MISSTLNFLWNKGIKGNVVHKACQVQIEGDEKYYLGTPKVD